MSAPTPTARPVSLAAGGIGPIELVRIGAGGLAARRLRSALTALGIAIGIAAMVGVLAISESSSASLLAVLDRLGTNLLTVSPGRTLGGDDASLPETASRMIERIGPVDHVSAVGIVDATVRRTDMIDAGETGGVTVYASDTDLLETLGGTLRWGRFHDAATSRYLAVVLGAVAATRLGLDDVSAPIDVYVAGHWFSVIGVLDGLTLAPEIDRAALIGWEVAEELLDADRSPTTVYVRADDRHLADVRAVLPATTDPENPDEVAVSRPSDAIAAAAAAATTFTALFLGLGAIALLVGGLGIANVMLMAVLERRAEIGLRRALGATRGHIAGQFVAEALLLAGLGGAIGVGIGSAVGATYARSQGWLIAIPPVALVGGVVAALVIGAAAGLYPALRAAATPPTDALRTA